MKKKFFIALFSLTLAAAVVMPATVQAQKSSKEAKKAARAAENAITTAEIAAAIDAKLFSFVASEITSTGIVGISNIKLNALWNVTFTPSFLNCYLPIYGSSSPTRHPTLMNRLDFNNSKYTYEVEDQKNGGWFILVKTVDQSTNTDYRLEFSIPPLGKHATLRVTSTFTGAVTFTGDIRLQYGKEE